MAEVEVAPENTGGKSLLCRGPLISQIHQRREHVFLNRTHGGCRGNLSNFLDGQLVENVPAVLPVLEVLPVKEEEVSPLTPCTACGRSIAKEAATCPNCGAPNKWFHPEIVRFYQSISEFEFGPSVQFTYEKFVLCGVDQRAHKDAQSLANLAGSFGVIAPMNLSGLATIVGVRAGQEWANEWARKKIKAFRIDFTHSPPSWSSTDDAYWRDVMDFFGVRRRKKRRRNEK